MERSTVAPWNAKENGNNCYAGIGGEGIHQSSRAQLNKPGYFILNNLETIDAIIDIIKMHQILVRSSNLF